MEDRYIGLQIASLVLSMLFTIAVYAQRQTQQQSGGVIVTSTNGVSQETRDALQDARLNQILIDVQEDRAVISEIKIQMTEMNSTLARLNAIGFAFGSVLSGLLALDVYFRIRTAVKMGKV